MVGGLAMMQIYDRAMLMLVSVPNKWWPAACSCIGRERPAPSLTHVTGALQAEAAAEYGNAMSRIS